ncbi:cytoskeletal protein binding protein [Ceratobasidium sp. 392]|nr:cytoskeletal protein binding protein [Ceratobasidium sp. 392]
MVDPYISVLTALYEYTPKAGYSMTIPVKQGQMLLLLDAPNDNWWKVKIKTNFQEDNGVSGLIPRLIVQKAEPIASAEALQDYTGQLSITTGEPLSVYERGEEWSLVKSLKPGGKAGYVITALIETSERLAPTPESPTDSGPRRPVMAEPHPDKIRIWHDETGQFKVEAKFLGLENGDVMLHKTNGIIVKVPFAGMSLDDMTICIELLGKPPHVRQMQRPTADGPRSSKTRIWTDRTGRFTVEAKLLGLDNSKIKLHKTNGVIIDVLPVKMAPEDLIEIASFISAGPATTSPGEGLKDQTLTPPLVAPTPAIPAVIEHHTVTTATTSQTSPSGPTELEEQAQPPFELTTQQPDQPLSTASEHDPSLATATKPEISSLMCRKSSRFWPGTGAKISPSA